MMHMTFYWSREVTLLVDSWQTESWTSYAFSLFACLIASAFYQFMEDRRLRLRLRLVASGRVTPSPASPPIEAQAPLLVQSKVNSVVAKVAGAVLFGVNSAVGYLLMLAIMSFNGGVFVAIVLGLAIGYLLFRSGGGDDDDDVSAVVDNRCACD